MHTEIVVLSFFNISPTMYIYLYIFFLRKLCLIYIYFLQVSIVAASSCRYVYWQRSSLEYLFVKEPYLASVVTTLIARDITTKLYAMNNKIVTERGSHLDIRLPSISHALARSPRRLRAKPPPPTTVQPVPPEKRPSEY